ncbi:MAG: peptidoglycan editing factor PgeF [Casimicrobium sp.]
MLLRPNWDAPANIRAAMTTREGGVSLAPYDSLNLGYSTQDDRSAVAENERRVAALLGIESSAIRWAYQVHGNIVHDAEKLPTNEPLGATTIEGDAIVSRTRGLVCGVKVADCMPVLFAADDASVVGAAHAGWRGLSSGVLENTITAMGVAPARIVAWLGPCIGATKFEVGEDVRGAFLGNGLAESAGVVERAFVPLATHGKYLCDLRAIARERLRVAGVTRVSASDDCTMSEPDRYFSHRRDKTTGRMAAFIGIK